MSTANGTVERQQPRCFCRYLSGKLADAFHQIAVGFPVPGDDLSQNRDHLEAVRVVKPLNEKSESRL